MMIMLSLCKTACFKTTDLALVTCYADNNLEITKWVCLTVGILAFCALLFYFIWKIIELNNTSSKTKFEKEDEKRDKERQLLIDYRKQYLSILKDQEDKEPIKTYITSIIDEQKALFDKYDKKKV